jgi:large subunit ribosomal protein L10
MTVDTADVPAHARATVRPDKAAAVSELAEAFRSSSAAVLTEYRGLTVKQVTALRVALGSGTTYSVVKNTLTRRAAADAGMEGLEALLTGPTAVAFVSGDPVEAAKGLRDFARANPALVVKGGVLDGKALSADEIRRLADLESREVLLAKMAGALKASLTNAVYLLAAPLAQTARLAAALQAKAEEDPSIIGGAGTPVASESTPDSTPDSTPVPEDGGDTIAEADDAALSPDSPADGAPADGGAPEAIAAEGVTPAETDSPTA